MTKDYHNQFQLDGRLSIFYIKPRVAPTKYVKYTGSQQLPLLDSCPTDRSTSFDLQPVMALNL